MTMKAEEKDNKMMEFLIRQIEVKDHQIEAKDRQIEQLLNLLDTEQKEHLRTMEMLVEKTGVKCKGFNSTK